MCNVKQTYTGKFSDQPLEKKLLRWTVGGPTPIIVSELANRKRYRRQESRARIQQGVGIQTPYQGN